jgi:hypothetical protein
MKQSLRFLCSAGIVVLSLKVYCQTTEIKYDFSTKSISDYIPSVITGKPVIFKIENINRSLYNVKITSDQVELTSTTGNFIRVIKGDLPLKSTEVDSVGSGIIKQAEDKFLIDKPEKGQTNDSIGELEKLEEQLKSLIEIQKTNLSTEKMKENAAQIQSIKVRIEKAQKEQRIYQEYLLKRRIIKEGFQGLLDKARQVEETYNSIESLKYAKNRLIILSGFDGKYDVVLKGVTQVETDFPNLLKPEVYLYEIKKRNLEFNDDYVLFINRMKEDNFSIISQASLEELKNKVDSLSAAVTPEKYETLFNEIRRLHDRLCNPASFSITSTPIVAEKDIVIFKIEIKPQDGNPDFVSTDQTGFEYSIPVVGGWRSDFSTGLLFNFFLQDRSYSLDENKSDPELVKIRENTLNSFVQPSVSAFLHIYKQSMKQIIPTVSLGIGLSASDLNKASYMAGIGILIKNKSNNSNLNVNAGLAMSQIDYLKGKYNIGDTYSKSNMDDIITEKTYRPGLFVSLTFTFLTKTTKAD